eukprot:211037-Chlamydomonas_euryale.AAC.1
MCTGWERQCVACAPGGNGKKGRPQWLTEVSCKRPLHCATLPTNIQNRIPNDHLPTPRPGCPLQRPRSRNRPPAPPPDLLGPPETKRPEHGSPLTVHPGRPSTSITTSAPSF